MQNRVAVVLSLGMLLEKIDTSGFIAMLLKKAMEENSAFVPTPELQRQAFLLFEKFNQGGEPKVFEAQLLQLLGIKKLESIEFWSEWNKMVTLGKLSEKVQLLQEMGHKHNALIYLSSDTNVIHLERIAKEVAEEKMELDTKKQPVTLEQFPLYVSCQVGKNRQELIKHIVSDIRSKEFNKPNTIILILGNPENIKDKSHQAIAKREHEAISVWCKENNVVISLHNHSLQETLAQVLAREVNATDTQKLALTK